MILKTTKQMLFASTAFKPANNRKISALSETYTNALQLIPNAGWLWNVFFSSVVKVNGVILVRKNYLELHQVKALARFLEPFIGGTSYTSASNLRDKLLVAYFYARWTNWKFKLHWTPKAALAQEIQAQCPSCNLRSSRKKKSAFSDCYHAVFFIEEGSLPIIFHIRVFGHDWLVADFKKISIIFLIFLKKLEIVVKEKWKILVSITKQAWFSNFIQFLWRK